MGLRHTRESHTPTISLGSSRRCLSEGVPRVLKPYRGNGGIGVQKVELVRIPHEATSSCECKAPVSETKRRRTVPLQTFMRRLVHGSLRRHRRRPVDRPAVPAPHHRRHHPLLPRQGRGRGLRPAVSRANRHPTSTRRPAHVFGLPAQKTMFAPDEPTLSVLRQRVESRVGTGHADSSLTSTTASLPVLWDADFLLGPKTASGEDTLRPVRDQRQLGAALPADGTSEGGSSHARLTSRSAWTGALLTHSAATCGSRSPVRFARWSGLRDLRLALIRYLAGPLHRVP